MKLNSKSFLFLFIRVLLGTIFILSAIFKLISIDTFELYIFSLKWFSFNVAAVLARLVISVELLLGILLITNIKYNIVWRTTVTLLTLFSLFLFYQVIRGEKENCHCFGEMLRLSPLESLIKNIIMLGLLFLIRKEHSYQLKYRSNILLFSFVFCFTLPLVISRPDFLINWEDPSGYTMETISARIHDSETLNNLKVGENKKMLCLFSVTCEYCIHAANKISLISNKYDLNNNTIYVFTGDVNLLNTFWDESNSAKFTYDFLPMKQFFSIAGPSVPSIYLLENGKVVKQYNYRSINEKEIQDFFETE